MRAEVEETLGAIAASRIHVHEARVMHGIGKAERIVRVEVDHDYHGDNVKKVASEALAHVLNPFPATCPLAKARVVCPERGRAATEEGGGEDQYHRYLKTRCAHLSGVELSYPAVGYGKIQRPSSAPMYSSEVQARVESAPARGKDVTLSQCTAACNDNPSCKGFSYSRLTELMQHQLCILRGGDVQVNPPLSPDAPCMWNAFVRQQETDPSDHETSTISSAAESEAEATETGEGAQPSAVTTSSTAEDVMTNSVLAPAAPVVPLVSSVSTAPITVPAVAAAAPERIVIHLTPQVLASMADSKGQIHLTPQVIQSMEKEGEVSHK